MRWWGGPKTAEAEVTVLSSDAGPIAEDAGDVDGGDDAGDGGVADGGLEEGGDPQDGGSLIVALEGVEHIDPPASVDDVAAGGGAFLFREHRALTVADTEMCDAHYPGSSGVEGELGGNEPRCQLRPGHGVDSWFLRVSNPSSVELLEGSVTFSREVVAIAWRDGTLSEGDAVFGAPDTAYTDVAGRGVAIGSNDALSLCDDRRTVSFSVMGTNADELRILVAADDGPRPLVQTWTLDVDTVTALSVGSREDAEHALVLDEGVTTLVEPLSVDGVVPGQYGMTTSPVAGTLPAGSTVHSWLVHFDPPAMVPETPVLVGSLTFDRRVLAVIVHADSLAASDGVVGRDDVTYAVEGPRGTELSSSADSVWWSSDGKSLRVELGIAIVEGGVDQLRILTEPEDAEMTMASVTKSDSVARRLPRAAYALALVPLVVAAIGCARNDDELDGGGPSSSGVVIDDLQASPSVVMAGSETRLSWTTRNAAACTLSPGFGSVPRTGSVRALPAATTTYTLACSGGGADASDAVTVEVMGTFPVDSGPSLDGGSEDASLPDEGDVDAGQLDAGPAVVVSGDVAIAGASVTLADLAGTGGLFLLLERTDVSLGEDLACDAHYPATYDDAFGAAEPGCVVPAGASLDTWLLHAPQNDGGVLTGTVTFSREIVALQWRAGTLAASDLIVGREGLDYDDSAGRSFGVGFSDVLVLGDDRRTLTVTVYANNPDEVRVLTLAEGAAPPLVRSTTLVPGDAPDSLVAGAVESLDEALLVFERSLTLPEVLPVDIDGAGRYSDPAQLTGGAIAAGTSVKSALVHYDPPSLDAGGTTLVVSGTLPTPVLGLLVLGPALNASDALLGAPSTTYETGGGRVMELTDDEIWLSPDGRSFRLDLSVGNATGIDDLRLVYAP